MKTLLPAAMLFLLIGCAKEKAVETPPETAAVETQPTATTAPPVVAQSTVTLPADAPIPASGVLLWLRADDIVASDGKVSSWQNPLVPGASANAVNADQRPALVPNAINGHAVVRFDGTDQMLMSNVDISPARMPEGTVITVLSSTTAEGSPLRKIYGDDNGGFDRTAGLDDRAGEKHFTVFTGMGVAGYFQPAANTTYIVVDDYSPKEFSGWVNGSAALTKEAASWHEDALPNLYIGGTGTVFQEYWSGDLAEMIVYARRLSDAERMQVEDYLAQKYGVTISRQARPTT